MKTIKRGTTHVSEKIERDFNNKYLYGNLSYSTLCDLCFTDMVLCNDIQNIEDYSIYDNMEYERDEEEENDDWEYPDIYQWFIVEPHNYWFEQYKDNFVMTYSDKLNVWILCVTHFGTGWDYVATDVKIIDEEE